MTKVCLIGIGKTGKEIAKTLLEHDNIQLVSVLCGPNSNKIGKSLSEIIECKQDTIQIESTHNLADVLLKSKPDVVVDFSKPEATLKNVEIISRTKINLIIGTTGFSDVDFIKLKNLIQHYHNGIVYAPNITLGVNVLMILANLASILLDNYDFHISEIHHKNKLDIPSGTALKIAEEIKQNLAFFGKDTEERNISIEAVRVGGVVGKHEVLIAGEHDKITISHESFSRRAFAVGAIQAINFIKNKTGFYEMKDVLNLSNVEDMYTSKEINAI